MSSDYIYGIDRNAMKRRVTFCNINEILRKEVRDKRTREGVNECLELNVVVINFSAI